MQFSLAILAISATTATATNFLIIQPDDMPFYEPWSPPAHLPWTGTYPGEFYPSNSNLPWINKLRNEGMVMTNAYAASPKCGTSRYSTVTGRYPSRSAKARRSAWSNNVHPVSATIPKSKLDDLNQVMDGDDCSHSNIAQVFSSNDYVTGMVGKWHLTVVDDIMEVDDVKLEVQACGFQEVGAMYPDNLNDNSIGGGSTQAWAAGIDHNMEYVAYKAVEFIEANASKDWFLYVNPTVPHSPDVATAMDVDCRMTTDGDFTSNPTGWDVPGMTTEYDPPVTGVSSSHGSDCVAYRNSVKARAGLSDSNADLGGIWVDDAIGAIYNALVRSGQLDDTVILFQLDHGKEEKDKIWEGGIRIPQFIHWPNGNLPTSFDGMVSTIDIGPTMLDISGILSAPITPTNLFLMDGKSWINAVHNLNNEADAWQSRCLFFENDQDRAVRCGCDKYMLMSAASPELAEAVVSAVGHSAWTGWAAGQTEALFDLCSDGTYISADDATFSPEANNIFLNEPAKVADLADLMQCHLDKTDARNANTVTPDYTECTGAIATPSPTPWNTPQPTLPVANNGGVPLITDTFPRQNDAHVKSSTFTVSATVLDEDIQRVRFNLVSPDGIPTGFDRGDLVPGGCSGHSCTYEYVFDTTSQSGKYGLRITVEDHSGHDFEEVIEFVVADTSAEVVAGARAEIRRIINEAFDPDPAVDINLAAKFVRHGFHDCVGGCDGCVDMTDPDNAGLDVPIAALEPVVNMFSHYGVTRADIWVLAALEGVSGQQADGDPDNRFFTMDWIGRPTCDGLDSADCKEGLCQQDRGPARALPSPNLNTHDLLAYFSDNFNFDARDTVAIMGAHTLGKLARENSGYNGVNGWLGNTRRFGNGYYDDLIGGENASSPVEELMDAANWGQIEVDNSDIDGMANKFEWERGTNPDHFVMINTDIALVRDLDGYINSASGQVDCQFRCNRRNCVPDACPMAAQTFDIATEYAFDNGLFIEDFESAFKRMLNKGFDASGGCLPANIPCTIDHVIARRLRGNK